MTYEYAVIWCRMAKTWVGEVRPRYFECKCFKKLYKAIEFSNEWTPAANIYKLLIKDKGKNEYGR